MAFKPMPVLSAAEKIEKNRIAAADAARDLGRRRRARLNEIENDPYMGYPSLKEASDDYKLNSQAEVLSRLLNRENVFVSGPAGSGKSTLLNRFREILEGQFDGKFEIALTASTGIAAKIVGGQTIHSWAGLGIDKEPFDIKNINPGLWNRRETLRQTDVLIIDEISMLPAYLFDKLDAILKWARKNPEPFGGVQMILTGDFLQLPPVSRPEDTVNTGLCIATDAWKYGNIVSCYMDKSHRATDRELKYLLAAIAANRALELPKVGDIIDSRRGTRAKLADPKKVYTTLFTTNKNVDEFNQNELNKNPNDPVTHYLTVSVGSSKDVADLLKKYDVPEEITLKVGAVIMTTSNSVNVNGPMNGSLGTVIEITKKGVPKVRFNDGTVDYVYPRDYRTTKREENIDHLTNKVFITEVEVAVVSQLPIRLGYAITVHRSQGQTLDGVVCDLSKIFTDGLGYVALSRVRSLQDLVIVGWSDKALKIDPYSRKVSAYVRREARNNREQFLNEIETYEGLLTDDFTRFLRWDVDKTARVQNQASPKGKILSHLI